MKNFFYFEQEDLCLRINKNKEKIYVCDKIKFSHKGLAFSQLCNKKGAIN